MRQAYRGAILAAFATIATAVSAAGGGLAPLEVRTIPITSFKPGSSAIAFGKLHFLGGFTMLSVNPEFGSWSGLDFASDGTMVAIADTGQWLTAKLVEHEGKPVGLSDARIGVMLSDNGQPAESKFAIDAEGLRIAMRNGHETALVSYEGVPAIRSYAGPDYAASSPKRLGLPKYVAGLRRNQGLEGLAIAPADSALGAGTIVAIAEHSLNPAGNHRGFILSGPRAGTFAIRRSSEFDISDAAFLAGGDLLILERSFAFSQGFAMRIRRIPGDSIKPGATVDGETLIEADGAYQIDNMEGLAVRTDAAGRTLLTLVSDDNHGFLQRSILLQFALDATTAE
jgi:hypothetical protein